MKMSRAQRVKRMDSFDVLKTASFQVFKREKLFPFESVFFFIQQRNEMK